jgi:hypothetical protein
MEFADDNVGEVIVQIVEVHDKCLEVIVILEAFDVSIAAF